MSGPRSVGIIPRETTWIGSPRTICLGRPVFEFEHETGSVPRSPSRQYVDAMEVSALRTQGQKNSLHKQPVSSLRSALASQRLQEDIDMIMDAFSSLSDRIAKLEGVAKDTQVYSQPIREFESPRGGSKVHMEKHDVSAFASSTGKIITKDELDMLTFHFEPLLDDRLQEVYARLRKVERGSMEEGKTSFHTSQQAQVAVKDCAHEQRHSRVSKASVRISDWEKVLDDRDQDFELEHCVWDASVFIFSGSSGPGTNAHLLLLLFLNIAIQVIFCVISAQNFATPSINAETVDEADLFRTDIAHDQKYAISVSGQSLASRVCMKSGILEVASGQVSLLTSIDSYLGIDGELNDAWSKFFSGPLMCILALACWGMSVIKELDNVFVGFCSLVSLTSAQGTLVSPTTNDNAALVSISFGRCTYIFLMYLVRISICAFLTWVGALFLVTGIDVGELLLNAVALDFIMSVDELIYEALAPSSVVCFIGSLVGLLLVYVGIFRAIVLLPMIDDMYSVKANMCNGNRDFVVSTDALGLSYLQDSPADDAEADLPQRNAVRVGIAMQSISYDVFPDYASQWAMPIKDNATSSEAMSKTGVPYENFPRLTKGELIDALKIWCHDGLDPLYSTYLWSLINLHLSNYGLPPVSTNTSKNADSQLVCATLEIFCTLPQGNAFGNIVRFMCSRTCQCENPLSLTFSHHAEYGCPSNCIKTTKYLGILNEIPCKDDENLGTSPQWLSWRHAMRNQWQAKKIDKTGCKEVLRRMNNQPNVSGELVELCWGVQSHRPFAALCPVSCGCTNSHLMMQSRLMRENCPKTCDSLNAR